MFMSGYDVTVRDRAPLMGGNPEVAWRDGRVRRGMGEGGCGRVRGTA
jgi:hypothetical protein